LESYARAHRGEYRLLELPERIDHRPLPPVHVVDMKRELAAGNRTIFSQPLREKITERLERREQVILFLNRRGHSTFVLCRECGFVARCPHCDIALTYHQEEGGLTCHYCGHAVPALDRCPVCRSPFFRYFGVGTEKVEREVERFFPESRTLRLDLDTTRRLGSHERILGAFAAGEADILIGTQMVAKGLDLPRVTLVGVVTADTALNLPDFRAAEKTFQILTQVAGRTGRGEKPGEVIVQTYAPDHYSIQAAAGHDYRRFWEREVAFRKPGGYPPFGRLINVIVASPKQETARETAHQLGLILRGLLQEQGLSQRGGEVVCPGIPDGTGDAPPSLTVVGDPALGDCLQTAVSAANPPGRPLGKDRSKSSRGKERQGSEARRTEWCVERGAAGRHVSAAGGCGGGTPPDIRGFSGTAGAAEGGRAPRAEAGGSPPDAQIGFFSGLLEEVAVSAQTDAGTGFGLANEGVVDPEVGEAFVFGIGSAQVLGPVPAPLPRLRGNFRWQILLKGAEIDLLRGVLRRALSSRNWTARVRISVDVDPVSLL
ncbi:MAG: primosomal protein N', partial [Firmicutes bacterium]|nr:primosomal protein N' [Bacillota bacterium]